MSEALQAYTGYKGNSQPLIDEVTAHDSGIQITHRSQGTCQVNDPNELQRKNLVDNLWYERKDNSTLDEKTHEAMFHKELAALFKITESIKQDNETHSVPIAAVALDAQPAIESPTVALLAVMAQDLAHRNEEEPRKIYQTWYQLLREPLNHVAERHDISFKVLLYNVSPFWLPNLVQAEYNLDEQQVNLYFEDMERVSDGRRPERSIQRTLQPPAKDGIRQRKRVLPQLPSVFPESEKLAIRAHGRFGPSGFSATEKKTTGPQRRSHSRVDLLYMGQHCRNHASSG